jgi:hypothetical protein
MHKCFNDKIGDERASFCVVRLSKSKQDDDKIQGRIKHISFVIDLPPCLSHLPTIQ